MYSDWSAIGGWLLPVAAFIWLGVITFLVWQQNNFLKSLFPKSGERDIRKKFGEVLQMVLNFNNSLGKLENRLNNLDSQGLTHLNRVELLRFNPYEDAGGDQSFSAAFLDSLGSGIVVTSLHARSGTRVFAKPVVKGKAGKYQFSQEEQEVIDKAMRHSNE